MNTQIIIPEYTADDFRNSSEPYSFIQEHADDPFLQRQLLSRLKMQATACGVRDFMAIWKSYQSSLKRQNNVIMDNATDFPDQPLELQCNKYVCDVSGVKVQDIFGGEEVICAHPIIPIGRLCNVDDGCERLEIAYRKGAQWRTLIAEKAVLASSSGILQLAAQGVYVNSENAKSLSSYLFDIEQWNYDLIPEKKSVGRLGWVGGEFSPYVPNLTFDGEDNYRHIFSMVKSEGSREKWIEMIKTVRAEKTAARIVLAASFASAILQPCNLLPFFVHMWGSSEYGKTVSIMIAASVWASPKVGDYVSSFNSTGVGTEMLASFLNSMPLCLDELQMQSSMGIKDFDRMIYSLTEGLGKTRGAKTGGIQKQRTWKNCIISCGEQPITHASSGGGAVNRVIEVELTEKICSDMPKVCEVINANYGFAGREFVEYLQTDGAWERVNKLQKEYYRELLKFDSTDKQAASASAILAADQIATEMFFKDGNALTVEDISEILTKKSDVDVNARALDYIYELVERNPIHFKPNEFGDYKSEIWGKLEYDYIYIMKSVFDREMSNQGFNGTAFLSWAKRRGLLDCNEGRRTKRTRILSSIVNTVCIKRVQEDAEILSANFNDTDFDDEYDLPM